uniref:Arrestin_N domain-containing protein n=1 Tax=Meloidogyne hapla TaxID=6305 RepID=A0A1I8BLX2_MELHA
MDLINIFITRAFYYDYITINETKYERSLIVIFNIEKKISINRLRKGAVCITYKSNGKQKWHRAYIEGIIGEKSDFECKISVYRLFCPQLSINRNENIENIDVAIRLSLQAEPFHVCTYFN